MSSQILILISRQILADEVSKSRVPIFTNMYFYSCYNGKWGYERGESNRNEKPRSKLCETLTMNRTEKLAKLEFRPVHEILQKQTQILIQNHLLEIS